MYIKRYTIAAFILIALVGAYVYAYVTQDTMSIDFFGIPLPSLSIAVWIIIPLVILYIASVLHMSFYSILGSMKLRKYEKDYEKIIDAIVEAYLGKKSRTHTFKTERYKLLGTLLENTALFPISDLKNSIENEKIKTVLKLLEEIKAGEVVDLKPYHLLATNDLVILNERNRYKKGELTAEAILSNSTNYDDSLRKEVYVDYVKTATYANIEKYKALLTKESLYVILARVNADENLLEISSDEVVSLVNALELTKEEYIKLSSVISQGGMIPEQRIKLFELLSDEKEVAMDAYLYTLFDLEMLTVAEEVLRHTQADEYLNFKAYSALKDCNKNFSIELFV